MCQNQLCENWAMDILSLARALKGMLLNPRVMQFVFDELMVKGKLKILYCTTIQHYKLLILSL